MYNYHPRLLAKSNIEKQYFSHRVNDVCNGSPSRIRRVRRISFGMTILPKSSTRRTMPVAFIFLSSPCGGFPVVVFAEKGEVCMKRVFWRILFGVAAEVGMRVSPGRGSKVLLFVRKVKTDRLTGIAGAYT